MLIEVRYLLSDASVVPLLLQIPHILVFLFKNVVLLLLLCIFIFPASTLSAEGFTLL